MADQIQLDYDRIGQNAVIDMNMTVIRSAIVALAANSVKAADIKFLTAKVTDQTIAKLSKLPSTEGNIAKFDGFSMPKGLAIKIAEAFARERAEEEEEEFSALQSISGGKFPYFFRSSTAKLMHQEATTGAASTKQ